MTLARLRSASCDPAQHGALVEIAAFLALHGSRMCRELDASSLNVSHLSCSICVKHRTAGCPAVSLEGSHAHLPQMQLDADSSKRLQLLRWHGGVGLEGTSFSCRVEFEGLHADSWA